MPKMGRPYIYEPDKPRRQRGLQLTDELWEALGVVAGEGRRAEYVEKRLREIPEIATILSKPRA